MCEAADIVKMQLVKAKSLRSIRVFALSTLLFCLATALVPASAGAAFHKAIWGLQSYDGVDQFPLYRQLGVSIIEESLYWSEIAPTQPADPSNPSDPAYQWPLGLQQTIAEAAQYHMQVLLQPIDAPAWADGGHTGAGWAPTSASTFVQFIQAAAREYPTVHLWMIWGEPTKEGNFLPMGPALPGQPLDRAQRASDRLYAEMVDGSYGVLKALSRSNLVIGGCTYTTGAIDPLQWMQNMRLPNGKAPRMDMYAHNPFSYSNPTFTKIPSEFDDIQFQNLPELAKWVDRYVHKGLPLFLSEWTIPTASWDQLFNFWVEPPVAAQWIKIALHEARGWNRIYGLGWVNVYDEPPITAEGLLYALNDPKPGFYSFARG